MNAQARYFEDGHKVEATYRENCRKCNGTGRFRPTGGGCFACKGVGYKEFKTDATARAKASKATAAKKARNLVANLECVAQQMPEVWAWIEAKRDTFDFAAKMHEAAGKFGELTPGQEAACLRMIEGDKARAAARAERAASAPAINTALLEEAFNTAKAKGSKRPKMRFDGFQVSEASASSQNAGALYVKSGGEYYGKVQGGKFLAVRSCPDDVQARVVAAMADPLAAAIAYGKRTGDCAICGRTLTDPESVERGIGPTCAENIGY